MLFSSSRGERVVRSGALGSRIHEARGRDVFLDGRNRHAVKRGVDDCKRRIVVVWEEP